MKRACAYVTCRRISNSSTHIREHIITDCTYSQAGTIMAAGGSLLPWAKRHTRTTQTRRRRRAARRNHNQRNMAGGRHMSNIYNVRARLRAAGMAREMKGAQRQRRQLLYRPSTISALLRISRNIIASLRACASWATAGSMVWRCHASCQAPRDDLIARGAWFGINVAYRRCGKISCWLVAGAPAAAVYGYNAWHHAAARGGTSSTSTPHIKRKNLRMATWRACGA